MNNLEVLEELNKIKNNYPITTKQRDAIYDAAAAIRLLIPKPPIQVKACCSSCRGEIKMGQKVCENCGQWILWEDGTK